MSKVNYFVGRKEINMQIQFQNFQVNINFIKGQTDKYI